MGMSDRNTQSSRKKGGDGHAKSAVSKKRPKGGADGDAKIAAPKKTNKRRR